MQKRKGHGTAAGSEQRFVRGQEQMGIAAAGKEFDARIPLPEIRLEPNGRAYASGYGRARCRAWRRGAREKPH